MLRSISIAGNLCHVFQDRTALYKTSEPAFLVDRYSHKVLKHGPLTEIQAMRDQLARSYARYDLDSKDLHVVAFDAAKVDPMLLQGFMNDGNSLIQWCDRQAAVAS